MLMKKGKNGYFHWWYYKMYLIFGNQFAYNKNLNKDCNLRPVISLLEIYHNNSSKDLYIKTSSVLSYSTKMLK